MQLQKCRSQLARTPCNSPHRSQHSYETQSNILQLYVQVDQLRYPCNLPDYNVPLYYYETYICIQIPTLMLSPLV